MPLRLLDTESLKLKTFIGEDVPRYGILSHCWRDEEVLFHDIQDLDCASKMAGFAKIKRFCEEAHQFGHQWVWVDTCCIDKTSSAELSEATNSMYRWYERAGTCVVYLDDVGLDDPDLPDSSFRRSRWFTRGWTLQELVASSQVVFFSRSWGPLGMRYSLADVICDITKMPKDLFIGESSPRDYSIAQRMSWAADRNTTLVEDRAYSLMGLFDIFIPIIYGEGRAAFQRLQREIIQHSADQSIFAWCPVELTVDIDSLNLDDKATLNFCVDSETRLLAASPSDFKHSTVIFPRYFMSTAQQSMEFTLTHHGVRIRLPLVVGSHFVVGILECGSYHFRCGILLQHDRDSGLYHPCHIPHTKSGPVCELTPLVRIPLAVKQQWLDRAEIKTIILSHHPANIILPRDDPEEYDCGDHWYRGRLTFVLGSNIMVGLEAMDFFLDDHVSTPGGTASEDPWEIHSTEGGDLLMEYRFEIRFDQLNETKCPQFITAPSLLFCCRRNRKAFFLEFQSSTARDCDFPCFAVKFRLASPRTGTRAVSQRAHNVYFNKREVLTANFEARTHYISYWIKDSFLLNLVSSHT